MHTSSQDRLDDRRLLGVVRGVRRRWRVKVALRGLAVVTATGLATLLFSAYGMEAFQFSPTSVTAFRVVAWTAVLLVTLRFLVSPLARRVSDEQVALYLEEHEPDLEARVLSALEVATTREGGDEPAEITRTSPVLARRVVESAIESCRKIEFGRRIERSSLQRSGGILSATVVLSLAFLLFGPGYLRHGMSALLSPTRSAEEASPYSIRVEPGDVTVARGSDQVVKAELKGFRNEEVDLLWRRGDGSSFEPLPMIEDGDGGYEVLLLDLDEPTEYFVRSGGVRSDVFTIEVADLPAVERLELEYRFPDYTGLPPRTVENGGDIAAVRGTVVRVSVVPTMTVPGGRLSLDDSSSIPLRLGRDGGLSAELEVTREGFYQVELERPGAGQMVRGSPLYTIDVLDDQPPSVSFSEPGRDTHASAIDEVFVEARADDDYGIGRLELVFSVNGGPEERTRLFARGASPMARVSAGHTFFLEEYDLEPGDVIAYWARAVDDAPGSGQEATSDIYFLQIRPFRQDFREADDRGSPQGGARSAGPETLLSQRQREIVAGTFNLVRDRDRYSEDQLDDNRALLATAQGQLRDQVTTLLERVSARARLSGGSEFEQVAQSLEQAGPAMDEARDRLRDDQVPDALPFEQQALQHLLRAEEVFREVQVSRGGGGGGGGQGSSAVEDLVDLYELELDKLRNQYETVQRGRQEQVDDQLDETRERLKELARRQQQELERQRRQAENLPGAQSGGGGSQRRLADETEEAARRLERLARETGDRELQETARQLQDAADAMRRSAADPGNEGSAEAGRALDRLDEARRRLDRARADHLGGQIDDALERARRLARQQREMAEDVRALPTEGSRRQEEVERILQQKDRMGQELEGLERQLDELSADARTQQREASRKMKEAADGIRDGKVKEKLRYSKSLVSGRDPAFAGDMEEQIAGDLEELSRRVEEARGAIARPGEDRAEEALDRTRDLLRGMESLSQRMEAGERGRGAGEGRPGEGDAAAGGRDGSSGGERSGFVPGGGGSGPRRLDPDRVRQFRSEVRQRLEEARGLQRDLGEIGEIDQEAADLTQVLRQMRALEAEDTYGDPAEVDRLRRAIVEGLKAFEYALRRQVEGGQPARLFLSGSDDVPEGFRSLVEEYYRALARDGGR